MKLQTRILMSVTGAIALLALISTLAIAETAWWSVDGESYNTSTKNYQVTVGSKFMQIDFHGKEVLPSKNIHVFLENIGGYTSLEYVTTSPNQITSANCIWKLKDGTTMNSGAISDSVPTTTVHSAFVSILIPQTPLGITLNITGNVLIKF